MDGHILFNEITPVGKSYFCLLIFVAEDQNENLMYHVHSTFGLKRPDRYVLANLLYRIRFCIIADIKNLYNILRDIYPFPNGTPSQKRLLSL